MKFTITKLFCMMLAFAANTYCASAQNKDSAAIHKVLEAQVQAWNNGDIDAFMKGYWNSDSLLFVGSKGPNYGWQTTLENYKKSYPDTTVMGKLVFTILETKMLSADHAFILGKWHLTRSIGDIGGFYTLLFKKINGQWYIIVDHTS